MLTTTQRVTNILEFSMDARNSDKQLWIIYAQKSGAKLTPEQLEVINNMPEFETLRRVRQAIQAKGMYPATPTVAQERKKKADILRDTFGGGETDLALELINKPTPEWLQGIAGIL